MGFLDKLLGRTKKPADAAGHDHAHDHDHDHSHDHDHDHDHPHDDGPEVTHDPEPTEPA